MARKILVLAESGMGLYQFRKELLQKLIAENDEVYISLPEDEYTARLVELGCKFIRTRIDRRGIHLLRDGGLLRFYIRTIRGLRPDAVLTYSVKPNIYGGVACRVTNTPYLANITDPGAVLENKGVLQVTLLKLYKVGLKNASCIFFQNESNRQYFLNKGIVRSKTRLLPGSGVNLEEHGGEAYPPDGLIHFLFVGRIMKAKGVGELLEAAKRIKRQHPDVRFHLVGGMEEKHLGRKLAEYENYGIIKYHGEQRDVRSYIKNAHAVILPSYHEGASNVLLEAAATCRPVLASRVTGCRETFDEGISGLGFEAKNANSLMDAIHRFIELPYAEKEYMGLAGRAKMVKEYDRSVIINTYLEEIGSLF
ncbi:glycosyltransferase family 4 protein [Paenibacillus sp. alder61]|uniref:Glycosyltransferase family 4 protein n=1 Tax=Paenibacillus faecis TaxID=862114 RepID=A0A5D0CPY9_9BACL|nr:MULTISPECIES: glycosyltransferase family 4 protein [Paenibacillus]MCA1293967.1 glycosyltransferase family 4 protein [Paenibacillus sp. alder61]TYA11852.1 glycosyltransferase family 4 protein [Paenibacillus faecis]